MAEWLHLLSGHEFGKFLGDSGGWRSLVCMESERVGLKWATERTPRTLSVKCFVIRWDNRADTCVSHWKLTAVELHTVQPQQSWWGDVGRMGKSPEIRVRKPGLGVSLSNYLTLGKSPKFKESTWNCSFILSGMLVRIKGIEYLRTFWCLFINVRQNWVWEMCSWMEGWQWKQGVPGRRERKE